MADNPRIVIIGGVAAGPKTAARARRLMPNAEITIIEKDGYISYAGCGMPFYLGGQVRDFNQLFMTAYGVARDEGFFAREKGVTVLTRHEAIAVDREKKQVLVRDLTAGTEKRIPYDKLVLATGSNPVVPPLPGLDLQGVYQLYNPADAQRIKEQLDDVGEAVIVGAGLIGLEVADALRSKNAFATVVELQDQILPGLLDADLAAILKTRLEEQGLEIRLGEKVLEITGEDGRVTGVKTDREEISGDMVLIAVGVRPNVSLAREAGLEIGQTGAIAVNEFLQTSDPDIYAVGDCVENRHLISGQKVYLPMATYANRQGRVAGDNLAGLGSKFAGVLGTAVLHVMGWNVARTGLSEKQARAAGFEVETFLIASHDRTHYHPGHGLVLLKVIGDARSRRLLGVQGIGPGDVVKRIDVAATAMHFGATVDQLAEVDLAYAPPFNTPIDPLHHTANAWRNKLQELVPTVSAARVKEMLDRGEDFVLLDVRTPQQFAAKHIEDDRVLLVTLGDMRQKLAEIPRDKEIVTLCAMGSRAYEALRILKGAGFENVKLMEGGLQAWPYEID